MFIHIRLLYRDQPSDAIGSIEHFINNQYEKLELQFVRRSYKIG